MPAGRSFLWMGAVDYCWLVSGNKLRVELVGRIAIVEVEGGSKSCSIGYRLFADDRCFTPFRGTGRLECRLCLGDGPRCPGAVVGPGSENPNVFAQTISVKGGEQLLVIARASSIDKPTAFAMIQINWLTAEGQFITAFQKSFEVTPDQKTVQQPDPGATRRCDWRCVRRARRH